MSYRIEFRPAAERSLRKLDPTIQRRLRGAIEMLSLDPHPPASRRLVGRSEFRLRVGEYRIIYSVDDGLLTVLVLTLGHRRDIYNA